uniref:Uncharacterized protein n=1 Tax=Daphnia magna TaxID=35525 RepID=A0A0P6DDM8_9CRUS
MNLTKLNRSASADVDFHQLIPLGTAHRRTCRSHAPPPSAQTTCLGRPSWRTGSTSCTSRCRRRCSSGRAHTRCIGSSSAAPGSG